MESNVSNIIELRTEIEAPVFTLPEDAEEGLIKKILKDETFQAIEPTWHRKLIYGFKKAGLGIPEHCSWVNIKDLMEDLHIKLYAEEFLPKSIKPEYRLAGILEDYSPGEEIEKKEKVIQKLIEEALDVYPNTYKEVGEIIHAYSQRSQYTHIINKKGIAQENDPLHPEKSQLSETSREEIADVIDHHKVMRYRLNRAIKKLIIDQDIYQIDIERVITREEINKKLSFKKIDQFFGALVQHFANQDVANYEEIVADMFDFPEDKYDELLEAIEEGLEWEKENKK